MTLGASNMATGAAWPGAPGPSLRFSPLAFLLFLALCLAVNWPGRLNEDSLQQFIGFLDRDQLGDLHSPLVAWMWSIPALLVKQPAAALIVQSGLLAFWAAMLPGELPRTVAGAAAMAVEAAVKLSAVILAGFVIKDVLLVGLLLAALAALQRASGSGRRGLWLAAAALLLFLSLFVRPTNFVTVAAAAVLVVPLLALSWRARAAIFAGILILSGAAVPLSAAFNSALGARRDHAEVQLILFDAAGISARTGEDRLAGLAGWPAGLPDPRRCYTPAEAAIVAPWAACRGYGPAGQALYARDRSAMIGWWLREVAAHPGAWLAHRAGFASHLADPVGAAAAHPVYSAAGGTGPRRYLYSLNRPEEAGRMAATVRGRAPPDAFSQWKETALSRVFARLADTLIGFRAAVPAALLASLLLLGWTCMRRLRGRILPPVVVPAAAGLALGNFLMHALLGVASQERYLLPTLFCAAFALIAALRHLAAHEKRRPPRGGRLLHSDGTP